MTHALSNYTTIALIEGPDDNEVFLKVVKDLFNQINQAKSVTINFPKPPQNSTTANTLSASPNSNLHEGDFSDLFPCNFCNRIFRAHSALAQHTKSKHGFLFFCSTCKQGFKSYSAVKLHEKRHVKFNIIPRKNTYKNSMIRGVVPRNQLAQAKKSHFLNYKKMNFKIGNKSIF